MSMLSTPELIDGRTVGVRVDRTAARAVVAANDTSRSTGLAGQNVLLDNQAMLFVLDAPTVPSFWMKGVVVPIDIIWVNDGTVSEVTPNVPPAVPGTPDELLPRYQPQAPVDRVLEVNAGWAAKHNIQPGDPFSVTR